MKKHISLILVIAMLLSAVALLCACGTDTAPKGTEAETAGAPETGDRETDPADPKTDGTQGETAEGPDTKEPAAPVDYDGMWLVAGTGMALYISGDTVSVYEVNNFDEMLFVDETEKYFSAAAFDRKTGSMTVTDEDGDTRTFVISVQDEDKALWIFEDDAEMLCRISRSSEDLRVVTSYNGYSVMNRIIFYVTEDQNYGFALYEDRAIFMQFKDGVTVDKNWKPSSADYAASRDLKNVYAFSSGCMVAMFGDEVAFLRYTVEGERLTVSGLQQIILWDDHYNDMPVTYPDTLTFNLLKAYS